MDRFIESSNFFTIDVASFIGIKPDQGSQVDDFVKRYRKYLGDLTIPGIEKKLTVTLEFLSSLAGQLSGGRG